jgi:hypothetical protein
VTLVGKDEKLVSYFQAARPETIAVTAISSTPLQLHIASRVSLPVLVGPESSCATFVKF